MKRVLAIFLAAGLASAASLLVANRSEAPLGDDATSPSARESNSGLGDLVAVLGGDIELRALLGSRRDLCISIRPASSTKASGFACYYIPNVPTHPSVAPPCRTLHIGYMTGSLSVEADARHPELIWGVVSREVDNLTVQYEDAENMAVDLIENSKYDFARFFLERRAAKPGDLVARSTSGFLERQPFPDSDAQGPAGLGAPPPGVTCEQLANPDE